ncbi:MAG: EAL domain-containing protein [Candidatus Malihini olakiniferum]
MRKPFTAQSIRAGAKKQSTARSLPTTGQLASRSLVSVEALARWHNGKGKEISPEVFVRIAEENGMIDDLTRAITCCVIRDMRPYLIQSSSFTLSINLAVSDIISPDYHRFLQQECKRNEVMRGRVILELTERSTASPHALAVARNRCSSKGIKLLWMTSSPATQI